MLTEQEIRTLIDNDEASKKKQLAKKGVAYYEGQHDIEEYRIFFINADGKLEEDKTKYNSRISHPFFKLLADQEAQYMLSGKDGFIKSDTPELQAELDTYFNENESYLAELLELLTGTITKGFEYMYACKDADGRTKFECADSLGVVEVRAKDTDDHCEYLIYWYVERIEKDTKAIKHIEVWDADTVTYYTQVNDGDIELDEDEPENPRPHTLLKKKGSEQLFKDSYGLIPFFRLDNNKKQISGLMPIKKLIDDYDIINSGLTNSIEDTNEALYVVRGFQGDNLDELMTNIKAKKHIGVDEEGGVDVMTVDIPVEARKTKMDIDKENIFFLGMGVNTEALKDTSATTSVAIKSAYANLDLKCDGLLPRLKQFIRKQLDIVLAEINKINGTDYQQKDVYFNFEREIITNALENAQIELTQAQTEQTRITTLLNTAAQLGDELLVQQIFDVLELDYEEWKDKLPKPEEDLIDTASAKETLDGIETEPVEDGDVIE